MGADFRGLTSLSNRECLWIAPVLLAAAAWSMAQGRLFPTPVAQLRTDVPEGQGHRPSQVKQKTLEFKEQASGSTEAEYRSAGNTAPDQHPQHGVEDRSPNRTEASRRPQGTNRGGGQNKRGDAARRKRAKPKQPQTTQTKKTHKTTEEETNNTRQRPRHTRNSTGHQQESTQAKQQPTHQDRQSRPINRAGRLTRAPTHYPESENENGVHSRDRRPTRQPRRKVAKSQTKTGRNELKSTSAPVQSADRHTSTRKIKTLVVQW